MAEETLASTHYQVMTTTQQRLVIETNTSPEPGWESPIALGFPLFGVWGYGNTVQEAIENLVFDDPLYPSEEEMAAAKSLYGAVKAAHPELTPSPDPVWWEG